jgi:hypothetical protein
VRRLLTPRRGEEMWRVVQGGRTHATHAAVSCEDARHDQQGQKHANDGFGRSGKGPVVELQSCEHKNLTIE